MKYLLKIILMVGVIAGLFTSCDKIGKLPFNASGTTSTLSSSSINITPAVSDSNKVVVTFSWTNPNYATDSSNQKFILEIDSTGHNFSREKTRTVIGALNMSFTGNQIDSLVASFGYTPGQSFSFDIRMTSSYRNNNDQLKSNVLTVKITPYVVPITLTPTSTSAIVLSVTNATAKAIGFNWNASAYGADTISYALQFDTVGGNFAHPQIIKYGSSLTSSITVNDLNTAAILAGVLGGSTKNMEFRIAGYIGTSYTTMTTTSNVVNLSVTTYTPVPSTLYIVGDATPGGWSNPVPLPSQQFTRLDAVSYGITISLAAGKSYLILPVNGDWSQKYAVTSSSANPMGDAFGFYSNSNPTAYTTNIPAPATSGTYYIVVNFQTGKYTVTASTATIPSNVYMVGDATAGGWSNPVPVPSQQLTQIDAVTFGTIQSITGGKSYLLLPVNGSWDQKYAVASSSANPAGDIFGYYSGANPTIYTTNFPAPSASGYYQMLFNFQTNKYTVTPFNGVYPVPTTGLYIVGDATPGGWSNPVSVPSQQFTQVNLTEYQLTIALTAGKSYLLLPTNGSWDYKYAVASSSANPMSDAFGYYSSANPTSFTNNIPAPATSGTYLIDVNFATGTYTLTKQ